MTNIPTIEKRSTQRLSEWLELVTNRVAFPHENELQTYHSLAQADYVSMLAFQGSGRIRLVSQYRPALRRTTLELPSGLREGTEDPRETAERELHEEAGLVLTEPLIDLGPLWPDTGRLENKLWCFLARSTKSDPNWIPEVGIDISDVTPRELGVLLARRSFDHALHVAVIGLAVINGHLRLPVATEMS